MRTPTSQTNGKGRPSVSSKRPKSASKPRPLSQPQSQAEPATPRQALGVVAAPSTQKRPRESLPAPQRAKKPKPPPKAVTTKVIRRVEAVVHVKQEDDSDEEDLSVSPNGRQHPADESVPMRDVARSSSHYDAQQQRGHRQQQQPKASGSRGRQRASRSRVIHDEDEDGEEDEQEAEQGEDGVYHSQSEGSGSEDEEEEVYAATAYNPPSSGRLRNLSRINYREEDVDDDEDELTMGAEVRILSSTR